MRSACVPHAALNGCATVSGVAQALASKKKPRRAQRARSKRGVQPFCLSRCDREEEETAEDAKAAEQARRTAVLLVTLRSPARSSAVAQGASGVAQGLSGVAQGSSGVAQGSSGVAQGFSPARPSAVAQGFSPARPSA